MKIKLSYKIFTAFLLTAFTALALMIGIIQTYVSRNFADYVTKMEMEKLSDLVDELSMEYQNYKGWEQLRANPRHWRSLLRSFLSKNGFESRLPPHKTHKFEKPQGPDRNRDLNHPPIKKRLAPGIFEENGKECETWIKPPPPPQPDLIKLVRRISLFDAQKHPIIGNPFIKEQLIKPIKVNSTTIGWLGLRKRKELTHPLDVNFLKQQSIAFYLIGFGILILSAVVSFILSKHLLSPIMQLTDGTKALAARKFDTRINIKTKDELEQLADDFNMMAQTLGEFEQLRKQWVSDISHELRTPLSIMYGEIEAMQDGIRDMNQEALRSLHSEVRHISKIVNDLYDLSLADTEALYVNKKPVDPIAVLKRVLDIFKTKLTKHQITIQSDLERDKKCLITGDADRLSQLFTNLLENTIRYTDKPGVLKIRQEQTDGRLAFYFEDSGPGVPQQSLERLFDRLYRVDISRARSEGGSGLGLSICKSIVDIHNGKITADNAPSGGLRIQIFFPITKNP